MTKRELFVTAWTTARAAAARFGGSARDFFAICLREAYAASRRPATFDIELTLAEPTRRKGVAFDLAYMPTADGYTAGVRGDQVAGHSDVFRGVSIETAVVPLPTGAFVKHIRTGGYARSKTWVSHVAEDGKLVECAFRNIRRGDAWVTLVEGPNGSVELA